jgi:hemerythrin-like metal-binding protein
MPSTSWDDRLKLHIPDIDQQHQKLVQMIDDLHEAMVRGRSREVLLDTLSGLVEYTRVHFDTEERHFAMDQYPGTSRHNRQHREFVTRVTDFQARLDQRQPDMSIEVLAFLRTWLVAHIEGSDGAYGRFHATLAPE